MLVVKYGQALLEYDSLYAAVLVLENLFRSPAVHNGDALFLNLCDFILCGGHFVALLKAEHCNLAVSCSCSSSCNVGCNVTAADYYNITAELDGIILVDSAKEGYAAFNALCILAGYACKSAALKTDSNIECLVALSTQLIKGDVLANLNAALDLSTHSLDYINFSLNNLLVKTVVRDTVCEHTARTAFLLKYCYGIALCSEIICSRKTCRTCTDNSDFEIIPLLTDAVVAYLGDIILACVKLSVSKELLDFVDSNGLVDKTSCTSVLTTPVADSAAYCGERVILADKLESFLISALCSHLYVALYCKVSRAGCLTG